MMVGIIKADTCQKVPNKEEYTISKNKGARWLTQPRLRGHSVCHFFLLVDRFCCINWQIHYCSQIESAKLLLCAEKIVSSFSNEDRYFIFIGWRFVLATYRREHWSIYDRYLLLKGEFHPWCKCRTGTQPDKMVTSRTLRRPYYHDL